ncbi:hypothetical protein HS088_TW13G00018 [Tripterygium wilfordii]|uniref:Uncharacterized protein n=1 Tax=Tripterygium wilfordii TaxID=458696 RepID=A0A7J7CSS5_TRIWF|nr:hypothetical protein HS088_TW13G00018 [Tripterygium wilfordii]
MCLNPSTGLHMNHKIYRSFTITEKIFLLLVGMVKLNMVTSCKRCRPRLFCCRPKNCYDIERVMHQSENKVREKMTITLTKRFTVQKSLQENHVFDALNLP